MTKLQAQLHRLYIGRPSDASVPSDVTRAVVLQITQPASWAEASRVWQGVQADLGLPAPAISVSGSDAYQLWFSWAQAVPTTQATAFAEALRQRYLPDLAAERIQSLPIQSNTRLPPFETQTEQWSAFVAPDLAPVFSDTPWLDIPPNEDGQAELLSRLDCIKPDELHAAWTQLRPPIMGTVASSSSPSMVHVGDSISPKQFLLNVMNDESVPLALRIEAAKALLPQA